ncbi:hypothetical protein BU600_07100 [Staphylococcus arlettae]|uniref:helix-hairpin-helix domain-containing protein n=1 Tax=Staphylococcus arlettae TaxID=29378 RepID=UPI000D19A364|nr:helix-hairpin-helix domain-containing protein [Staphylococcus arlettae]PTH23777.1 hypothetical protein BU602_02725 [Staphylococcus arlettae]PTH46511.1 hypothetical protein BU596_05855 [Staphylococcus arlettae]PTH65014.1 hypothetical protein BU595_07780 [Staphylococcus arlettae]PUZ32717.1 hypothetical protein BU606_05890 [Staphylococcus arlettae]RIM59194.1 hypothetical protein BU598_09225 [Staphylococcus arlettae]
MLKRFEQLKLWIIDRIIYVVGAFLLCLFIGVLLVKVYSTPSQSKEVVHPSHINDKAKEVKSNSAVSNSKGNEFIYVDIKGSVEKPSVYKMRPSDRVKQLLEKAVPTTDADLNQINLAEKLIDQKLIIIPRKGEITTNIATQFKTDKSNQQQVNLNTATEEELKNVNGIGPAKAQAIIEYRTNNGPFESVEQLKEIRGIGDKTFERLQSEFTV